MKIRLVVIGLVVVGLLAIALPVFAHANLLRSSPEANAALEQSPAQIELIFSETLEPSFSSISVLDSNGNPVDNGDARVDSGDTTRLTVSVRSLPDGVYTVAWRVLSAVDSHATSGAFPFAVGQVDADALPTASQADQQIKLSIGEVITKWVIYLAAVTLAGGALFVLLIWSPVAHVLSLTIAPPWQASARLALIGLLIANGLALLFQAGQASGAEIAAPWSGAANSLLVTTRYGVLWTTQLLLTLALVALTHSTSRLARWFTLGVGAVFLLTISLSSHAAADPSPALPVATDWLHLLAAGAWVGGLIHFAVGVWASRELAPSIRTRLTAQLIRRFSALALVSVGVLTLTGVYVASLRVGSWEALLNSLYGRALLVKLVIAAPMMLLGAVNLLAVSPWMQQSSAQSDGNPPLVEQFRRIVTGEVTLGVAVLLSVAVFTALPPARAPEPPKLGGAQSVDDVSITLAVDPGRVGINTFSVQVTVDGQPVTDAREVQLRFTSASSKVPPSQVQLAGQGDGSYSTRGAYVGLPDRWQVQVAVRRKGKFDAYANFDLNIGANTNVLILTWNQWSGVILILCSLAYLAALFFMCQTNVQRVTIGGLPAFGLVIAAFVAFTRPASTEGASLVNPIPPNQESIGIGQELYEANCVPCHGETGQGDGPVGLTLNPRPADLSLHAIPGVHTDGALYLWVTNGFPNSVMPAFKATLDDDQRWHLVNYIRTLAPK